MTEIIKIINARNIAFSYSLILEKCNFYAKKYWKNAKNDAFGIGKMQIKIIYYPIYMVMFFQKITPMENTRVNLDISSLI